MDFLKELVREVQQDDLAGGAAELAYRLLFALFPFFLLLAAISGFAADWLNISDPTDRIISELENTLPEDAASILDTQLRGVLEEGSGGLLSISAIAALWAASSATKTVMKWMNRVYNVEEGRPFIRKQAIGLALTLLGAVGFIAAALVLIVGQVAGSGIAGSLGLSDVWAPVVSWGRIPAVLLILMAAMAVVYWLTPNTDFPFKWLTPGAVLFVILWIAATVAFGIYVANFANYQATYGAVGGVIILMIWLYITSFVLLLGGKINAMLLAREAEADSQQSRATAAPTDEHDRVVASTPAYRNGTAAESSAPEHEDAPVDARITRGAAVAAAGALIGAVAVRSMNSVLRNHNGDNGNGRSE